MAPLNQKGEGGEKIDLGTIPKKHKLSLVEEIP